MIMGQQYPMTENEKELLNILGRHPELSLKDLVNYTKYKRVSSIARKIRHFRERNILWGPTYQIDYGKLCKNPIHSLFCIVELGQSYETVIEYLKLIEPLVWVYPVLSSHKELLSVLFISSNDAEVKALLQVLKDNHIITDYIVRVRRYQVVLENPDFFGDPVPSLDTLCEPCEFFDISFGHHDIELNECDIRILSYLQGGFNSLTLIEILKKERKLHNRKWTYEQLKYSHKKMSKNRLIKKIYFIYPFPLDQCADFFLFLKTEDMELTQRILCNFARGGRIHKEYTLCDDWGAIGCISHPLFVIDLMHKLDQVDEIKKKELYHIRSFTPGMSYVGQYSEFEYYDVETQTLEYPYRIFKEKIEEKLDEMSC